MRNETFSLKVGAGFKFLQEFADNFEVIGLRELGDGNRECNTVEVRLGSQRCSLADLDDAIRVVLGFKKSECRPGFPFRREWCG